MIVERFLLWARTAPVARRAEAADALARGYLMSPLSPGERDQVEAAMTVLLDDSATEVRLALAEALAANDQAPHHIILALAADQAPIAAIVAERSPLILDSELVDLIGGRDPLIQCAIARRHFVSRAVSAALAEVGCAEACQELLENGGARLPRFSLERVIERHGDCPELRRALLQRDDLPVDVRQVLLGRLSASLCALIVSRDWMPVEKAEAVTRDARECATIAAAFEAPAGDLPALVRTLMRAGELTPAFLIRAAVSGQTLLFEAALSELAQIPQIRIAALIASGRAASFRAVLQKAGLPPSTFSVFAAAVDAIRSGDSNQGPSGDYRRATHLVDAVVTRLQKQPDRELNEILALLRRFLTEAKRSAARGYAQQIREAA